MSRQDLVTAALLGLRRAAPDADLGRGLPGAVGQAVERAPRTTGPAGLLDAAALDVVARRAGTVQPRHTAELPTVAEPETARVAAGAARARLAGLVTRSDVVGDLLTVHWLRTAAERGYVVPPALLPEVLGWATRPAGREHRALVAAVLGARGRWLVQQIPAGAATAVLDAPETPPNGDAARASVDEPQWSRRPVAARTADVAAIHGDVRPDDEERLARCLTDRAVTVREAAAQALVDLPGSGFARDCAERALACVAVERQRLRRVLVVTLPEDDATAPFQDMRTGAGGRRARLLRALVAATPPSAWTAHLGRDAADLVRMDVTDQLAAQLHAGWRDAARRTRDATWAQALLEVHPDAVELLAVLPDTARAAAFAAAFPHRGPVTRDSARRMLRLAAVLPMPWPGTVVDVVLRQIVPDPPLSDWEMRSAEPVLAAGLPHDAGTEQQVRAVADRCTAPGTAQVLHAVADTLMTRRAILEELA
ncbi:DUF5691 domain-containing protein [Cellulomonas xiejunii]|uniref:DUF5691 domain-containing protein n=1 Tax=Cellulomonas xiejunii TaxID=2968083 RepID=A0ABY5KRC7_9CELL|nr:DUF5691 domain-containing protein [Cellulomonas xiejunii]MCC2321742.1 DUF5691 domain-containing protein [Cellulomonas xiejunii]UUI73051.1 DUF5691 domain-containing protein [Cellulomonas xiejunii]